MKKIAMVLPSLAQKGPIIVAKDIIENLNNKIYFEVFYFDDIVEIDFPCKVTRIDKKYILKGFDIVHSHMLRPDFYNSKLNNNTKKICTLHNYMYSDLSYTYGKIIGFIYEKIWSKKIEKFDSIVTLSNSMKVYYENIINNDNIVSIYNGRPLIEHDINESEIENKLFEEILNFKKNHILIGVFCLLSYRKGIDRIIKMLSLSNDFKLLVVGDGKEIYKLKKLAQELNINDKIFWAGFQKNVHHFYKLIDLNVMSSRSEGFPLALLEMGVNKIPVACVEHEIFSELYNENEVSFFLPDNPSSMLNACLNILENKDKFVHAFYEKTIKSYSIQNMANSYLDLYNKL